MPRLYSSDEIASVLLAAGFVFVRQRGSHQIWRREGVGDEDTRMVVLQANRRQIPRGTFRSILRQAGLDEARFLTLLD